MCHMINCVYVSSTMQLFHFITWSDQDDEIVFSTYDHELEKEKQIEKKQRNLNKFLKQNAQTLEHTHLFNFLIVDFIIKKLLFEKLLLERLLIEKSLWRSDVSRLNLRLLNINIECVIVRKLTHRRLLLIFLLLFIDFCLNEKIDQLVHLNEKRFVDLLQLHHLSLQLNDELTSIVALLSQARHHKHDTISRRMNVI